MIAQLQCGLNRDLSLNTSPILGEPTVDVQVHGNGAVCWGGSVQAYLNFSSENNRAIGFTVVNQMDPTVVQSLTNIMNAL